MEIKEKCMQKKHKMKAVSGQYNMELKSKDGYSRLNYH